MPKGLIEFNGTTIMESRFYEARVLHVYLPATDYSVLFVIIALCYVYKGLKIASKMKGRPQITMITRAPAAMALCFPVLLLHGTQYIPVCLVF